MTEAGRKWHREKLLWRPVSEPPHPDLGHERVVVFTPGCAAKERFRVVEAQFVRILTDATHWTFIEGPSGDLPDYSGQDTDT